MPFAMRSPRIKQRPVLAHRAQAQPMMTALVPIASDRCERSVAPADWRANAQFVAHLIATAVGAPQTRQRRRAEPKAAFGAYRTLGQWPSELGRTVAKSL
jgi:hypothetical protein